MTTIRHALLPVIAVLLLVAVAFLFLKAFEPEGNIESSLSRVPTSPPHDTPTALPEQRGDRSAQRVSVLAEPQQHSAFTRLEGVFLDTQGIPIPNCDFSVSFSDNTDQPTPTEIELVTNSDGLWSFPHDPNPNAKTVPEITFYLNDGLRITYRLEETELGMHTLVACPLGRLIVRTPAARDPWGVTLLPRANANAGQIQNGTKAEYHFTNSYGPVVAESSVFYVTCPTGEKEIAVLGIAGSQCTVSGLARFVDMVPRTHETSFPGVVEFHTGEDIPGIEIQILDGLTGEVADIGGTLMMFYYDQGKQKTAAPLFYSVTNGEAYCRLQPESSYYQNRDDIGMVCTLDDGERIEYPAGSLSFETDPHQVVQFVRGTGRMALHFQGSNLDKIASVYVDIPGQAIRWIPGSGKRMQAPWGERFRSLGAGQAEVNLASASWNYIWFLREDGRICVLEPTAAQVMPVQWSSPSELKVVPVQSLVSSVGEWDALRARLEVLVRGRTEERWILIGSRSYHPWERPGDDWKIRLQIGFVYRVRGTLTPELGKATEEVGPVIMR